MCGGVVQEAVRDCREALRADPAFWKAALRGGQASLALGRFEDAAGLLETAQSLSGQVFPEAAQATRLLGELRNAERLLAAPGGDGERALACARSVAAETPRSLALRVLLVRALVRCGRFEEALPLCKELRSLSASAGGGGGGGGSGSGGLDAATEAELQLAYARALAGLARLADALTRYRDLLRMDPDNGVYRDEFRRVKGMQDKMAEGDDAMRLQRFGAARRLYAEAMALDPDNEAVAARMRAGRARSFQLQRKEALDCETKLQDAQREAREAEEAVREAQKRLVQVEATPRHPPSLVASDHGLPRVHSPVAGTRSAEPVAGTRSAEPVAGLWHEVK
jgi:tetratricopeptide (TPR) repeat protein